MDELKTHRMITIKHGNLRKLSTEPLSGDTKIAVKSDKDGIFPIFYYMGIKRAAIEYFITMNNELVVTKSIGFDGGIVRLKDFKDVPQSSVNIVNNIRSKKPHPRQILATDNIDLFECADTTFVFKDEDQLVISSSASCLSLEFKNGLTGDDKEIYYLMEMNPSSPAYDRFKKAMLDAFDRVERK